MRHGGHGAQTIDHLAYASRMAGWNAGFKTLLALGTLALCLWADRAAVSAAVIVSLAAVQKGCGGIALRVYGRLLRVPLAFVLLGAAAVACDLARAPVGDWQLRLGGLYLCTSAAGLRFAGALALQSLAAVSALYLLALTTAVSEVVGVLRRAHLPALLCEVMYLVYRYIFVLLDTHARLKTAAAARLGYRDFRTACRSFGGEAGNLLVVALGRARRCYDAMAARGYDGSLGFLEEEKPWRAAQVAGAAAYWAALAALRLTLG